MSRIGPQNNASPGSNRRQFLESSTTLVMAGGLLASYGTVMAARFLQQ